MFDWLFKFDRVNFAEGEIGLQSGQALVLFAVIVVALLVGFVVVYSITNLYTSDRAKAVSLGLRIPALLLLCLPLLEPVLIMPDVVPDENFVAVLVDGSESMNVPDGVFGETRLADARQVLYEQGVLDGLDDHFKLRYYTFGEEAARTDSLPAVRAKERGTNLSAALGRVLSDFKGLPLAGVLLLTDGGDNSTEVPLNQAEALRGLGVPLHVVGLGQPGFEQEREILEVTVSNGVEETTGAEIDVKVRSWAEEPEPVTFELYRGDALVFADQRQLKGKGKIDQLTFFYEPEAQGAQAYTLRIAEARREVNTANNALDMLIDTRQDTIRVLYFEGQLRRDFKFIKRVLEDDRAVDFASVSRTGQNRYYRQGIKRDDELSGGFPADEAELYRYKVIILGDMEASAFAPERLALLEKAVRVRGSGLLMLGGRNTFAEGDYWDTPIADVLPVEIDPGRRMVLPPRFTTGPEEGGPPPDPAEQGFRFLPTGAGLESPILKLSPDLDANRSLWAGMPGLTSLNYLGATKPGAVVLAEKPTDQFGDREPLLVVQRYGKGRSAALATASTWRWQMQLDAEDARHERFWRQLVRWLAADAPNHVDLDLGRQRFAPGDEVPLTVNVYDREFIPVDQAAVRGFLTDPFGSLREVPLRQDLSRPGTYTAALAPQDEGVYELEVVAEQEGARIGRQVQSFLVRPSNREYYDATLKRSFLENLARTANGLYYEPDEARAIPANLRGRRTSTSIYQASYLWDMPFLFGLALLLLSAEWIYRRRKGLP